MNDRYKGLKHPFYFEFLTEEDIEACYNGMGAEWMPNWSRKTLDWLFKELDDAVRIHDVTFVYGDTKEDFHQANKDMRDNMLILAERNIPWWRWHKRRRFRVYWIPGLYKAVSSELGWKAFKEADKKKVEK